jgi:D-alanyl-D-alanine carboxypeptidase (penicillin-binding protein 5/6)
VASAGQFLRDVRGKSGFKKARDSTIKDSLKFYGSFMIRLLILCLFFTPLMASETLNLSLLSDSAILINGETGNVLFEKNAKTERYPASLTKVATALYALKVRENKLGKKAKASREALSWISAKEMRESNYHRPAYQLTTGASHIGIKVGEELAPQDLLYGLLATSAGDAVHVIIDSCLKSRLIPSL